MSFKKYCYLNFKPFVAVAIFWRSESSNMVLLSGSTWKWILFFFCIHSHGLKKVSAFSPRLRRATVCAFSVEKMDWRGIKLISGDCLIPFGAREAVVIFFSIILFPVWAQRRRCVFGFSYFWQAKWKFLLCRLIEAVTHCQLMCSCSASQMSGGNIQKDT